MGKYVIDYKSVDMEPEEHKYYEELVKTFTTPEKSGKALFRNLFDVDDDGCIKFINPPVNTQIPWALLVFLQNLMINQRLRRIEKKVEGLINNDDKILND